MSDVRTVRIGQPLYGGRFVTGETGLSLPFVLAGERVEISAANTVERLNETSPQRVAPGCRHFGICGGCHYQMAAYPEQLRIKQQILLALERDANLAAPAMDVTSAEPYHYRNRIRLRLERVEGTLRVGYNVQGTSEFLPVTECPIAASLFWDCAQALLRAAASDPDAASWMDAAREVELFANDDLTRVQITLLCPPRTTFKPRSLEQFLAETKRLQPAIVGMAADALDARTGRTGRRLAAAGVEGLNYRVDRESYWVPRGAFFQSNRFLLHELVAKVCEHEGEPRCGHVAWDLYAGVGLFSRVLARSFERVMAVEASAAASVSNRTALNKIGVSHEARTSTTLDFLKSAVVQRERPNLIVLDPPRAGAGVDVCALLLKIAAECVVYVSCDPTTLVRDLQVLTRAYNIGSVRLVDLFPQTFHMETVVVLERRK